MKNGADYFVSRAEDERCSTAERLLAVDLLSEYLSPASEGALRKRAGDALARLTRVTEKNVSAAAVAALRLADGVEKALSAEGQALHAAVPPPAAPVAAQAASVLERADAEKKSLRDILSSHAEGPQAAFEMLLISDHYLQTIVGYYYDIRSKMYGYWKYAHEHVQAKVEETGSAVLKEALKYLLRHFTLDTEEGKLVLGSKYDGRSVVFWRDQESVLRHDAGGFFPAVEIRHRDLSVAGPAPRCYLSEIGDEEGGFERALRLAEDGPQDMFETMLVADPGFQRIFFALYTKLFETYTESAGDAVEYNLYGEFPRAYRDAVAYFRKNFQWGADKGQLRAVSRTDGRVMTVSKRGGTFVIDLSGSIVSATGPAQPAPLSDKVPPLTEAVAADKTLRDLGGGDPARTKEIGEYYLRNSKAVQNVVIALYHRTVVKRMDFKSALFTLKGSYRAAPPVVQDLIQYFSSSYTFGYEGARMVMKPRTGGLGLRVAYAGGIYQFDFFIHTVAAEKKSPALDADIGASVAVGAGS